MEWQSFFIGMGVMMVLMAVVFALIPSRKNSEPDLQMKILHDFWRTSNENSTASRKHFESMAESLERIEGTYMSAVLKTLMEKKAAEALKDERAEEIVEIFKEAGLRIEPGAQYSVKGQIAQLLNGCKKLLQSTRNLEEAP
ncbi:MAG TPA: hypothetical protein ENI18_03000 [Candidatus Aminicenantes bacterium]|nr:hypothetical protein [Candidatus Aminicenantes bacterium]